MITRHSRVRSSPILLSAVVISAALLGSALPLHAQTPSPAAQSAPVKEAPAQQPYYGVLNDDNVYIRSGPSDERYYATEKLNKGAKITVVETVLVQKEEWLKIIPPEGSFSYVAKAHVDKRGDGSVGRVTRPNLNVRAGSSLNNYKTTVQASLEEGDDVKIIGEDADYFKIAPPTGAYLYVKKTFVDPLPVLASSKQQPVQPPAVVAGGSEPRMKYPIASEPIPPVIVSPVAAANPAPSTEPSVTMMETVPSTQPSKVASAPGPATQPVEPSADEKFNDVETAFLAATKLPLDQQPIGTLISQYTDLSSNSALPSSLRRIADRRVSTLKIRAAAQKDLLETQKMKAEAAARELALKTENEELVDRVKKTEITMYAAVGTLRISSLQQSGATMYRLTDPGTGRTLLYIRSNDSKYADMLNKFIGVNGEITEDTALNLKVIVPKSSELVDPAKVNTNVSATVIPPSMLLKTSTASVSGN